MPQGVFRPVRTLDLVPTLAPATLGILETAKPATPSTIAPLEPRIAQITPPAPSLVLEPTRVPATRDSTGLGMCVMTATSAPGSVVATIVTCPPSVPTPLGASLVRATLDSMEME